MSTVEPKDNPYVAIVARKHRNLKKKLEKIVKIEAGLLSGKTLDEEQVKLYASKNSVEKAIADIGQLKEQLEEVSAQENAVAAVSKLSLESKTEEVSTETAPVSVSFASTQYETAVPKASSTQTAATVEAPVTPVDSASLENSVRKLLRVFHVCVKYQAATGRPLPANVDFFGQTLLGQTSIGGFEVALEGALRNAGTYLNDELASQSEFVRGFTYSQMSDFIDQLAFDITLGSNNHSFASLSAAAVTVDKQPVAAVSSEPSSAPSPVEVDDVVYVPPVVVASEQAKVSDIDNQHRKPVPRERGPPKSKHERVAATGSESSPAASESADRRGPRQKTPRERIRSPAKEHPVAEDKVNTPTPAVTAQDAAEKEVSVEKRTRAPRTRKPRADKEEKKLSTPSASPVVESVAEIAAVHKPTSSGPPAKVWESENRIKAAASQAVAPLTVSPQVKEASRTRSSEPVVKNVSGNADVPSSGGKRGDRPRQPRPESDRPPRSEGDRPRPPRPEGDRPRPPRPEGDRPRPPRPEGDRPRPPRPEGDRPPRPERDRPRPPRPHNDAPRPARPPTEGGDKPRPPKPSAGPKPVQAGDNRPSRPQPTRPPAAGKA